MKKSQLELAIEKLEGERQILDLAIAKLKQQAAQTPKRKRTPKPTLMDRPA